jgi:progressive ankylosis protein
MLTYKRIFTFWTPLAATWLMMSVEGPFLAAIIARLAEAKYNLAAYGVAFSLALIIEAPIIMIMSASTALVKDRDSFLRLRNFTYTLNISITLLMVVLLLPGIFYFLMIRIIGLPQDVAKLTHRACILLLPWPGAIGYRRFYQGILIRSNQTRRVAYGTMIRVTSMTTTALILYFFFNIDGALVGTGALGVAVTLEAIFSRWMARHPVGQLLKMTESGDKSAPPITYKRITQFYYPLALTSILGLGVQPMITFFMGQSRMAIESLAVFPVVNSLVFIFRSMGLSYQEVGIALMGQNNENFRQLRNFAAMLGTGAVLVLSVIAFTPLSTIWYHEISGLSELLTSFSILPTQILVIMPALTVLLAFQRSVLVNNDHTAPITIATAIEVSFIIMVLFLGIRVFDLVGIVAAALAIISGRVLANSYLFIPYFKMIKRDIL